MLLLSGMFYRYLLGLVGFPVKSSISLLVFCLVNLSLLKTVCCSFQLLLLNDLLLSSILFLLYIFWSSIHRGCVCVCIYIYVYNCYVLLTGWTFIIMKYSSFSLITILVLSLFVWYCRLISSLWLLFAWCVIFCPFTLKLFVLWI